MILLQEYKHTNLAVTVTQLARLVFLQLYHHPEDGSNIGRNILVRTLWIKYIINIVEHFVDYLHSFGSDKYTEGGTL
jgi:hypothetical protein